MLAWRAACLIALVAVATAIPTMNLPTESPAKAVHNVEDTLHAEFVAWKAKVLCPVVCTNSPDFAQGGGAGASRRTETSAQPPARHPSLSPLRARIRGPHAAR
jgi:hypothetical protein